MSAGHDASELAPLSEEDTGRANLYALIGRLFYEAPDSILLAQLRPPDGNEVGEDPPIARAWRALHESCRNAYPVVIRQEFDSLFVGVGKSEVTPYTSHYIRGIAPDRHVVQLRERLDDLGLARRDAAFEVEDHVSGICDVMRALIVSGQSLSEQSRFFREFVYPGAFPFCDAVTRASSAAFYRYVAAFARAFFDVEREAFEMHDSEA